MGLSCFSSRHLRNLSRLVLRHHLPPLRRASLGVGAVEKVKEASWHRNLRKNRQQARGVLAANKVRALPESITSRAVRLLFKHHGSSIGTMVQKEKQMWLCKTCKGSDGKHYRNNAFRLSCHICGVGKGSCFGGPVPTKEPSHRTLAAKQVHAAKVKEKEDRKAMDAAAFKKQQAELKKLQQKIDQLEAKRGTAEAEVDDAAKEPGFKAKLRALEEEKAACEKFGYKDNLAKVMEAIKELKDSKEAEVPEGHQLKRAEQELAKRRKKSMASQAALEEAKKKVEELEVKNHEDSEKLQEAELDLEKIKARIASPTSSRLHASWDDISKGGKEFLEVVPPEFLDKAGIGASDKDLIAALLSKMGAAQTAFQEWRQAEADRQAQQSNKAKVSSTDSVDTAGDNGQERASSPVQTSDVIMQEPVQQRQEAPEAMGSTALAVAVPGQRNDATLEKLQRLAGSSNADEAKAAEVALCALGMPKAAARGRTSPY